MRDNAPPVGVRPRTPRAARPVMPSSVDDSDPAAGLLPTLAALVVKQGLWLGTLSERERMALLSLGWRLLPSKACREADVNDALRAALAASGALRCLRIDHVELRRWLVDGGWLQRDGYGRVYQRTALEALAQEHRRGAEAIAALDAVAWVEGLCVAREAARAARRAAWQTSAPTPHVRDEARRAAEPAAPRGSAVDP